MNNNKLWILLELGVFIDKAKQKILTWKINIKIGV
jgi:hypothetical protein